MKIIAEPTEIGAGFVFENAIVGGAVPKEYIRGVEKGLESVLDAGVLAGFPVVDLRGTLVDSKCHEVDSSVLAFEIAARTALRDALQKGGSVLLEPIMKVEVVTPDDYARVIVGDLNSRRGHIKSQNALSNRTVITAMIPLANALGYSNTLRWLSHGRAASPLSSTTMGSCLGPAMTLLSDLRSQGAHELLSSERGVGAVCASVSIGVGLGPLIGIQKGPL